MALAEAVEAVAPGVALRVKWPNDIMLDQAKAAGILIDAAVGPGGRLDWLVVGFGVNLAAAPDLPHPVTAIPGAPGPEPVAQALLSRLDHWDRVRLLDGFAPVRRAWLDRGPAPGSTMRVRWGNNDLGGTFAGTGRGRGAAAAVRRTGLHGADRRRPAMGWRIGVLLVVDAGNTNVVFAVHDGKNWRGVWRIATEPQRTSDEYAVWLLTLLNLSGLKQAEINRAVIGTVVPAALYHLRRLCRDWFSTEPLVARSNLDWGFEIKVDNPAEVGADRLLNTLAAHQAHKGPLVILDFGTATTFDVVDADGALPRRRHSAGHQPVHRGTAQGRGTPAPHRHRPAAGGDRPLHRAGHAIRHLLGLRRPRRGLGNPHPRRA